VSADLWAFLTSAPFLTLVGSIVAAVLAWLASSRQHRATIDEVREKALRGAYDMGDAIRDELRADLKEAKEALRSEQRTFIERVGTLERELAGAKRHIALLERLRCPRADCPVFVQEPAK
jgi:hypothetical protein